jgi:hypothetical protein
MESSQNPVPTQNVGMAMLGRAEPKKRVDAISRQQKLSVIFAGLER